jgi:hypothetical protein
MATASYIVGPASLFTPSDLAADASTLDGQVQALDGQVEGNDSVDPGWLNQWIAFQGAWAAFYYQDFGGALTNLVTSLNDSNRDQLIQYENTFQQLYASSGQQLSNVVSPSTGSQDSLSNLLGLPKLPSSSTVTTWLIVIAVIVVALVVVPRVLK